MAGAGAGKECGTEDLKGHILKHGRLAGRLHEAENDSKDALAPGRRNQKAERNFVIEGDWRSKHSHDRRGQGQANDDVSISRYTGTFWRSRHEDELVSMEKWSREVRQQEDVE